jgi:hypothetical protein
MSDEMKAAEQLVELQLIRKQLMKGIRLAVKRLGAESREVCIGRAVLSQLDELIKEQKLDGSFCSIAPLVRVSKITAS